MAGGVYNDDSTLTLINCVVWGNTAPTGAQIGSVSGSLTVTYSCVQGGWSGTGNISSDPLPVDIDGVDNIAGNIDDDLRPSAASPVIDAGNSSADIDVFTPGVQPLPGLDLDGFPRLIDDPDTFDTGLGPAPVADMGPFEFQLDCNDNDVSDPVDIIEGTSEDCDGNWVPDECESLADSDGDGVADACDVCPGCDDLLDSDGDDIPDGCDQFGDFDHDADVDLEDHAEFFACFGGPGAAAIAECAVFDADDDSDVDLLDFATLQEVFDEPTCP